MISSFHAMISSFHGMIPSFHGMISSFHAVFGLRQRDKSVKVIDYNDQVIRVREYLLFLGIPSPMLFLLSRNFCRPHPYCHQCAGIGETERR